MTIRLIAYPSDWGFNWGRSSGRLDVVGDRARLAEPFLPAFRGATEPWSSGDCQIELLRAPGLRTGARDEVALALGRPELRATPDWLLAMLDRDRVAIWHHVPSASRGLSAAAFTLPFAAAAPPALRHRGMAAARGSGFAQLDLAAGGDLLLTTRGPDGLDAVAARLAALGAPVERVEDDDWG